MAVRRQSVASADPQGNAFAGELSQQRGGLVGLAVPEQQRDLVREQRANLVRERSVSGSVVLSGDDLGPLDPTGGRESGRKAGVSGTRREDRDTLASLLQHGTGERASTHLARGTDLPHVRRQARDARVRGRG